MSCFIRFYWSNFILTHYIATAINELFAGVTKAAMDRNGIASFTSGILTNEALNLDTATRVSVQDAIPELSRTVTIPGSDEKVGINSLRKGGKRNPDLNRVYANNLDADVNRQLFQDREDIFKSNSPQKKELPNSVGGVPHAKSPPRKKRDTSRVDVDLVSSEKPPAFISAVKNANSCESSAALLEQLRPFRMAIVNRMKDKKEMLTDNKKKLQQLYAILSGVQNDLSQTIVTIASDSVEFDNQWTEEFKLNEMIDVMLSFF